MVKQPTKAKRKGALLGRALLAAIVSSFNAFFIVIIIYV